MQLCKRYFLQHLYFIPSIYRCSRVRVGWLVGLNQPNMFKNGLGWISHKKLWKWTGLNCSNLIGLSHRFGQNWPDSASKHPYFFFLLLFIFPSSSFTSHLPYSLPVFGQNSHCNFPYFLPFLLLLWVLTLFSSFYVLLLTFRLYLFVVTTMLLCHFICFYYYLSMSIPLMGKSQTLFVCGATSISIAITVKRRTLLTCFFLLLFSFILL